MKKDESVKEMYNRMKKIINQIKSLGGEKWGDHEIVDKLLPSTWLGMLHYLD